MIRKLSVDKKAHWELHLPKLIQAYNSTRSSVTGYSPHYLMFGRRPHLPVDFFFPTIDVNIRHRRVPTYVDEVLVHFKEAHTEAQHQMNSEADQQKHNYDRATSTVQLMLRDTVLKKADAFQGKRKVKDRWSKVEYEVICQVTNGMPSYEIKDSSGNLQVAHRSRLFLLATPRGEVVPLNNNEDAITSVSTRSALAELTPMEYEKDLPNDSLGRCQTQHLTSPAHHILEFYIWGTSGTYNGNGNNGVGTIPIFERETIWSLVGSRSKPSASPCILTIPQYTLNERTKNLNPT